MEQKPKKRKRYAFPYLLLGLLLALLLLGLLYALFLVYQQQPVTLTNILNLAVSNLAFLFVDIIGLATRKNELKNHATTQMCKLKINSRSYFR
jgi:hypothetical protein